MGSVKDLEILESPTRDSPGSAIFHFSDRYSVFDWGKMPKEIDKKGEALALMGAYTFEKMESIGIDTNYLGLREDGEVKSLEELEGPSNEMVIKLVNKLEPEFKEGKYDYSVFHDPPVENFLIPLEVIYRNSIPIGSSIRKRYSPKDLDLKMDKWPESTVDLEEVFVEASTKLEEQDRYITDREAEEISGVSPSKIYKIAKKVNEIVTNRARKIGMEHEDGKLEFLYIDDNIVVGDVAGTFDENRFSFKGTPVSKEILRQGYKEKQADWVEEVENAKEKAKREGEKDWKEFVNIEPKGLGYENLVSEMYRSGANRYVGRKFFEVRELEEIVEDLKSVISVL